MKYFSPIGFPLFKLAFTYQSQLPNTCHLLHYRRQGIQNNYHEYFSFCILRTTHIVLAELSTFHSMVPKTPNVPAVLYTDERSISGPNGRSAVSAVSYYCYISSTIFAASCMLEVIRVVSRY